ncbi:multidrug resistance protein B [Bifidobacterium margollesii]|uniref:Multidrug resistance protein B n=1 Tax=Bifidobacterium margollesii TaxID=2020964 RepID=A0A2N5JB40_9BIFI|nr:MFS transporter [Bifidobacterium margollesii]PLS31429.1 multidrug resistance protein B [Bifidobacterium margollesii]
MKNPDERLITRDVALVMLATFCFMASNTLSSLLMAGFSESLGASGAMMGLVAGMMSLVSLFCRPIAGNLSDRASKRLLVGVGSALYLISSIWYATASSPVSLLLARMVNGVGFACCSVCLATWMSLLLPIRHMGAGMGLYGTTNALAMALGPATGITMHRLIGYRHTFIISMVMAMLMVISVMFIKNGGHPVAKPAPRRRFSLRSIVEPRVVPLSLVFMLFAIPYFATQSFIVIYANTRHLAVEVSLFYPCYAVALLIMRIGFRDWFDRKSFRFFLVGCSAAMLGSLLCLDLMTGNVLLLLAAVLMAAAYGVMSSVTQAQAVIIAGKARSGIANATYYAGIDLGMTLGPVLGGMLYGGVPIAWFYPLFMLVMPAAWLLYAASAGYVHGGGAGSAV